MLPKATYKIENISFEIDIFKSTIYMYPKLEIKKKYQASWNQKIISG